MGSSNWSSVSYASLQSSRAAAGVSAFNYTDSVLRSQPVEKRRVHPDLDPTNIKNVRESRDSENHPESLAIVVGLDITGSMQNNPRIVQEKLPNLMDGLIQSGFVTDPQIMVAAFGDAYSDRAVLQIGQFESGIEIDQNLGNLWLEGGGGGSGEESPELLLWALANKTSIDCYEKRNKKGYVFIITDEMAYNNIPKNILSSVFGTKEVTATTLTKTLEKVKERYHVFVIMPGGSSHWNDGQTHTFWRRHVGPQNFLRVSAIEHITDVITGIIGVMEGVLEPDKIETYFHDLIHEVSDADELIDSLNMLATSAALVA